MKWSPAWSMNAPRAARSSSPTTGRTARCCGGRYGRKRRNTETHKAENAVRPLVTAGGNVRIGVLERANHTLGMDHSASTEKPKLECPSCGYDLHGLAF